MEPFNIVMRVRFDERCYWDVPYPAEPQAAESAAAEYWLQHKPWQMAACAANAARRVAEIARDGVK
jgi:hypothetical protein